MLISLRVVLAASFCTMVFFWSGSAFASSRMYTVSPSAFAKYQPENTEAMPQTMTGILGFGPTCELVAYDTVAAFVSRDVLHGMVLNGNSKKLSDSWQDDMGYFVGFSGAVVLESGTAVFEPLTRPIRVSKVRWKQGQQCPGIGQSQATWMPLSDVIGTFVEDRQEGLTVVTKGVIQQFGEWMYACISAETATDMYRRSHCVLLHPGVVDDRVVRMDRAIKIGREVVFTAEIGSWLHTLPALRHPRNVTVIEPTRFKR